MFNIIRQVLYLLYLHNNITKTSKQQFNQVIMIMSILFDDKKVIILSPKDICVDLPIQINESIKHHVEFVVNCKKSLFYVTKKTSLYVQE